MNALITLMTLSLMLVVAFPFFAVAAPLRRRELARNRARPVTKARLEAANMEIAVALATHRPR